MIKIHNKAVRKLVIKIGSNVLTDDSGLKTNFIKNIAKQVAYLKSQGVQVTLVSSGAIAAALSQLNITRKAKDISEKQALAAIGQPLLMQAYAKEFSKQKINLAQILLTHDCLEDRQRFLNTKFTFQNLFKKDFVPIVNENDTVSVDEIMFGDNDQLAVMVAQIVEADLIVVMSHVEGLFTGKPQLKSTTIVPFVSKIDSQVYSYIYADQNVRSTGGMLSKVKAAEKAMQMGVHFWIVSGILPFDFKKVLKQDAYGTFFEASTKKQSAFQAWVKNIKKTKGTLIVDEGAEKALLSKKSLLPSGLVALEGDFKRGDCVSVVNRQKQPLAKGLISYSAKEVSLIAGHQSRQIQSLLGFDLGSEVIHKDYLVLQTKDES